MSRWSRIVVSMGVGIAAACVAGPADVRAGTMSADLMITKSDGVASVTAGGSTA